MTKVMEEQPAAAGPGRMLCFSDGVQVAVQAGTVKNGIREVKYSPLVNEARVCYGKTWTPCVEVKPVKKDYLIRTEMDLPERVGVLFVGIAGNNGTTFLGGLFANRQNLQWDDKRYPYPLKANWLGSLAMTGTCKIATCGPTDLYVPVNKLQPLLHPDQLVVGGWDINSTPLSKAMRRAAVLPLDVQRAVADQLDGVKVFPGVYDKDFIATNQELRADFIKDNSLTKYELLNQVRRDIALFKEEHHLDKVIVIWNGNTERFCDHVAEIHDNLGELLEAMQNRALSHLIAPSLIYCLASVLEGCAYINGSPQNTFCNAVYKLAQEKGVFLAGDDLKTGQTKLKSVMAEFLVSTGLKPTSIVSYNHLGNNDGMNLSSEAQFRSKEITKASVIDDMVTSNSILYPTDANHEPREKPDHVIVIKYVPAVGDSKRAMDEYSARIFMNGEQTIVVHNTCEDSLLAAPIILDLILFTELLQRIQVTTPEGKVLSHPVQSLLSLFLKAPVVPPHAPVINALFPQKDALLNFLRIAAGLAPEDYVDIERRLIQAA